MVGKKRKNPVSKIIELSNSEDSLYDTILDPDGNEIQVLKAIDTSFIGPVRKKPRLLQYNRKGFYGRWITDREPDLYHAYLNRGFRFVKGVKKVYGGLKKDGSVYHTYLVEIPAKWYWEFFEKPKQEHNYRRTVNMLQRKDVENNLVPASHYAANGTPNSIQSGRGMAISEYSHQIISPTLPSSNYNNVPTNYDSSWDQN